jgi:hypothetical protein
MRHLNRGLVGTDSIFATHGKEWQQQRSWFAPALSLTHQLTLVPGMVEETLGASFQCSIGPNLSLQRLFFIVYVNADSENFYSLQGEAQPALYFQTRVFNESRTYEAYY